MERTLTTLTLMISLAGTSHSQIKDILWTIGPNIPEFRKGGCAVALGGKIISVFGMRQPWGEMDTMYIYDPQRGWWSRGPNAPVGQAYVQGTVCQGAFYAIGGRMRGVRNHCYRLEDKGNENYQWTQMPHLNQAKAWAPSVTIGSKVYVLGGSVGGHGPTSNAVEMMDTSDSHPQWKMLSTIPGKSRGWSGAAAVNGKIYLIGGNHFSSLKPKRSNDRKRLSEVLVYNTETGNWTNKTPLPYLLAGMDCVAYENRYIIVVGGAALVSSYSEELKELHRNVRGHEYYYCPFVLVYDTETDHWKRLPSLLPVPTNDIRIVLLDKKLYALGGENIERATSNTTPWFRIGHIIVE